jgi:hypothetical protein
METVSKSMAYLLRQAGTTKANMAELLPRKWYLVSNSDGSWTAKKLGSDVSFTDKNKHDAAALAWLHESKPIER